MKSLQPLFIFLGMIILYPLLFGLAYLLWNVNHAVALIVLFIGLSADVLGGLELLNRTLSHL
ncbi:hypothetical protein NIES2119_05790 [[Phormidium ambiguum] IAM M-71]|uniref:Uncharacterized protein n=1 Tax=[Phormidium ambiguum] IAM M-71 TaxID=454136 RepID=A0A1U7IQW2_9CYAN|nr:hypothetical protein [Phormidium ambiguum]OKH39758.1 hypothetical protein NIES2119_05790 [Phormidium ambiguum IAM M-71]